MPEAAMDRMVKQSLLCLSLVLLVLPLTHRKPGTPPTLKADEPAYYLAALSLVQDGDLRCEPHDLARAYREYPYNPIYNLILATDDGWRTVYFGKPYLFSLLAAPFAAVWGANGLVLFNSALLVAMIWMATFYLRRYNPDWLAALFAAGFFLMSTTYRYVYWLQPELLNMFSATACLFFGLHALGVEGGGRRAAGRLARLTSDPGRLAAVASAAALAVGVYNKPMMAALGLPVCFRLLRHRRWRELAVWLIAAALTLGAIAGMSTALTGHPTAYLGVDRQAYNVHTPHVMPTEPDAAAAAKPAAAEAAEIGKQTAGWWWIFQWPELTWSELREDLGYFFVGRHTGLFLYQPFSALALGLFFAFSRRDAVRWVLLGSLAAVALFFLVILSHNWQGGGGFVGNRYYLLAYPGFLFLVTRIRPDWIAVPGFAAAGLFVGALILSPFGLVVPSPTLQANVRNLPFRAFPLEHSLLELPGYRRLVQHEVFILGRNDHLRVEGEDLWIAGADDAELWLSSLTPLTDLVFEVESLAPGNEVRLRIEDSEASLVAGPRPQRVVLSPSRPTRMRRDRNRAEMEKLLDIYVYRLQVRTASGELPKWRDAGEHFFYQGCVLRFLGHGGTEPAPSPPPEEG